MYDFIHIQAIYNILANRNIHAYIYTHTYIAALDLQELVV